MIQIRFACLGVVVTCLGCASSAPAPTVEAPTSDTAAAGKRPKERVEYPLMSFQIPSLERDWGAATSLIPDGSDAAAIKDMPLDLLMPPMIGEGLAEYVDFGTRIDVGMFAESLDDDDVQALILAEIKNPSSALKVLDEEFRLTSSSRGAIRLQPLDDFEAVYFEDGLICEVWGEGKPKGYLTCGAPGDYTSARAAGLIERRGEVEAPRADTVLLEMPSEILVDSITENAAKDANPAEQVGIDLVTEFFEDLEAMRWGGAVDGVTATLSLELAFRAEKSPVTSVILGQGSRDHLEGIFFRLPDTSHFAARFAGMPRGHRSAETQELFRRLFTAVADEELEQEGIEPMTQVTSALILTGGASVLALGQDEERRRRALREYLRIDDPKSSDVEKLNESAGWFLLGLEEDADQWIEKFHEMHELDVKYTKQSKTGGAANKQPSAESPSAPSASTQPPAKKGKPTREIMRRVAPPQGAPAGTVHYLSETVLNPEFEDKLSEEGLPHAAGKQHLLLLGAGNYTWICGAPQVKTCVEHLKGLARGGDGTLENHPLRKALKRARGSVIGFGSVAGVSLGFLEETSPEQLNESLTVLDENRSSPEVVRKRMVFAGTSGPDATGKTVVRVEVSLPISEVMQLGALMPD